jgi:hypothetical protein
VTLKTLATGIAAVAVAGAAAAGVTSIASTTVAAPQVQPVVFGAPMPMAPAPDLAGPLTQTINVLGSGGSFSGKAAYIQGLGRVGTIAATSKYNALSQKGYFPLTAWVDDINQNGTTATANVTATAANGATGAMPLTFVQGPSPTGWQLSLQSLEALSSLG